MNRDFLKSIPKITKTLLIINIALFVLALIVPKLNQLLALYYFESPLFNYFQILTHVFMHGGLTHLLFNMYALFLFGSVIEKKLNSNQYLFLYFFSALGALLLHMMVIWFQLSDVPTDIIVKMQTEGAEVLVGGRNYTDLYLGSINVKVNGAIVGASGAIMGVLATFAYLYPNAKLGLIFIPVPIKAKYFVPFYMAIELFLGVNNFQWDNIAHFAHIGGAIFGLVSILFFFKGKK